MNTYYFLFIDIETTGHDPVKNVGGTIVAPYHEIIDIGAVLSTYNFKILESFEQKVRPENPERCISLPINNYPNRAEAGEWDHAVPIQKAIQKLLFFSDGISLPKVLIGQNISFDWSFLAIALAQCNITQDSLMAVHRIHYRKTDTSSMSIQELWQPGKPFNPDDHSLRKGALSKKLGILDEPFPHTALNGARACYEIFKKLRQIRAQRRKEEK